MKKLFIIDGEGVFYIVQRCMIYIKSPAVNHNIKGGYLPDRKGIMIAVVRKRFLGEGFEKTMLTVNGLQPFKRLPAFGPGFQEKAVTVVCQHIQIYNLNGPGERNDRIFNVIFRSKEIVFLGGRGDEQ